MDQNHSHSHFTCVVVDRVLRDGEMLRDGHVPPDDDRLSPAIEPFAEMLLKKLVQDRDRTSDECMGIGLRADRCLMLLMDKAASCLRALPESNLEADLAVKKQLSAFAVALWFRSHHRN